jgi:hypothetical protein
MTKTHVYNLPAPVDKSKTSKDDARELLLKEESFVREKVGHVQRKLVLMLDVLGELAIANPAFTHGQLPHLVSNSTQSPFFNVLHHNVKDDCQKMFCGAFIWKPRKVPKDVDYIVNK